MFEYFECSSVQMFECSNVHLKHNNQTIKHKK